MNSDSAIDVTDRSRGTCSSYAPSQSVCAIYRLHTYVPTLNSTVRVPSVWQLLFILKVELEVCAESTRDGNRMGVYVYYTYTIDNIIVIRTTFQWLRIRFNFRGSQMWAIFAFLLSRMRVWVWLARPSQVGALSAKNHSGTHVRTHSQFDGPSSFGLAIAIFRVNNRWQHGSKDLVFPVNLRNFRIRIRSTSVVYTYIIRSMTEYFCLWIFFIANMYSSDVEYYCPVWEVFIKLLAASK